MQIAILEPRARLGWSEVSGTSKVWDTHK